jgi:hypothetical protein
MERSVSGAFAEPGIYMRSLFLKIFLGFWLTVIVVGIALVMSVVYSSQQERLQLRFAAGELLPAATKTAAEEFERAGAPALASYLSKVEKEYPVFVFVFDQDGQRSLITPIHQARSEPQQRMRLLPRN